MVDSEWTRLTNPEYDCSDRNQDEMLLPVLADSSNPGTKCMIWSWGTDKQPIYYHYVYWLSHARGTMERVFTKDYSEFY